MNSIRFVFTILLLRSTVEAFVPRPTSSGEFVPWGVSVDKSKTDNSLLEKLSRPNQYPRPARPVLKLNSQDSMRSDTSTVANTASGDGPAKIIIAGAPASGKGTQCEKITAKYGVVHLSTGDMLRAAVAQGTEVGKEAKAYMDAGKLVPDSTIIGVVRISRMSSFRTKSFSCPPRVSSHSFPYSRLYGLS
jgi:hypothetical protein